LKRKSGGRNEVKSLSGDDFPHLKPAFPRQRERERRTKPAGNSKGAAEKKSASPLNGEIEGRGRSEIGEVGTMREKRAEKSFFSPWA